MTWLTQNYGPFLVVLLTLSEGLAVVFPSKTGFGGFLAGAIKLFKGLGVKDASGQ